MLRFVSGSYLLPHPAKAAKGGEDALFINDELNALGVADGVGGWTLRGIDPGRYARELLRLTEQAIQAGERDPVSALRQACDGNRERGSSTACVVILNDDRLATVNVGDSGFIILREEQVWQSRQITLHSFNFPFQLGEGSPDQPADGVVSTYQLLPDDLLVIATDGLWDNFFENQVAELATGESDMDNLARSLAHQARRNSTDPQRRTPWSGAALGGKLDDIAVIAARVIPVSGNKP